MLAAAEVEIPLGAVAHEQHYRAVITTAVQSGGNDQEHMGRQVAQWSMTAVIASQAGTAWSKVPVAIVGAAWQ